MPKRKTGAPTSKHEAQKQRIQPSLNAVSHPTLALGDRGVVVEPIPCKLLYFALSFLLPFVILGTVFAFHEVYPFGSRQILTVDFWYKYYPFLSDYWRTLREGRSLLWSWTVGGGIDYLPAITGLMSSPLNLLTVMVPHYWLREALTVVLLTKIGLAGLFFSIYLQRTFNRCDLSLPVFASLYALCAYTLGYYHNIMWFDVLALLPLVVLGLQALVRDGKYRIYIVSLALSMLTNYAIAYHVCIFVAIMFFGQCFMLKMKRQEFLRKLALIAASSVIALGLTAMFTFPAFSSLQNAAIHTGALGNFPPIYWLNSFVDVLGNLIAFTPPPFFLEGLPNLYSGMISVLLASMFVGSSKVTLREKTVFLGAAVFLVVSCNLSVLNYIWSGFLVNEGLPFRFSFLFSFTLVIMAFRAYTLMEDMKMRDLLDMFIGAALFLLMAAFGSQRMHYVIASAILCAAYLAIFVFFVRTAAARRRILKLVLFAVILTEVSITSYIGVDRIGTTDRNNYPDRYGQVQLLLNMRRANPPDFYRTEFTTPFTWNDPSLYGYNGISIFSSTSNVSVARFMRGLGVPAHFRPITYIYVETTPLINAFLNMRYLICRNGNPADDGVFWKIAGEADGSLLLENKRYLPLGFMVNEEVTDYVPDENNPFISQNDLFRRATGLSGDLFTIIDTAGESHERLSVHRKATGNYSYALTSYAFTSGTPGVFRWDYKMPVNGMLYVYYKIDFVYGARVSANGETLRDSFFPPLGTAFPYIFSAGRFTQGDEVSITAGPVVTREGNAVIYAAYINQELFDQGYALLAEQTLNLTEFTGTKVAGTVTALRDGLLYTSIPYERRWKAFVNGVESEILPVGGAMVAVRLSKGTHNIEFRYHNNSLTAGIIVSVISLAAFASLMIAGKFHRRKKDISNSICWIG